MKRHTLRCALHACSSIIPLAAALTASTALAGQSNDTNTATPIKHLIVIYGENRSFDHLYATYVPKQGQTVFNLLSQGIVNKDGSPGPNFDKAKQWKASDTDKYSISPKKTEPYQFCRRP